MTPFSQFRFSPTQTHRRKALAEVMPVGDGITYFVVLSDAYLSNDQGERHIGGFCDLREVCGGGGELHALQAARAKGQLTEGQHQLPDVVAAYLASSGTGSPQVRRWVFDASEPIVTTVARSEIQNAWAVLEFEEVEVGDPSGNWYFRARYDDPLVFLAVMAGLLSDQIRRCKEFCREVSGGFDYAP